MPDEKKQRDKHFSGGGSTGAGEALDPKKMPADDRSSPRRSVPIGIPISVSEYKKLKNKAKTDS
jgi:hypothetical protein